MSEDQAGQPAPDQTKPARKPLPAGFKPWQPGQSGNPGGKPKRSSITRKVLAQLGAQPKDADLLALYGEAYKDMPREDMTNADLVADSVIGLAFNRWGRVPYDVQLRAQQTLWAYVDGKPVDASVQRALGKAEDENRPLLSLEDFRRAVSVTSEAASVTAQEPQNSDQDAPGAPNRPDLALDSPPVPVEPDKRATSDAIPAVRRVTATAEDIVILVDAPISRDQDDDDDDSDQE